jgi:uncharacterized RDD family membrane protein YckC
LLDQSNIETMRSYWDEDLAILSAENVSFSVETAGLGSRFAAAVIDFTFQLFILLLGSLTYYALDTYLHIFDAMPLWLLNVIGGIAAVLTFILFYGYFFLFEWLWDGQTPGKRQLGLRVMMVNGLPLTVWPALARNIVRVADSLPICYGVGAIVALSNPLNQRAGDLVAGTIVARERRREKQRKPLTINEAVDLFLTAATTVPGSQTSTSKPFEEAELAVELAQRVDPEAAALALKLGREDYELARDFLLRRESLPREARGRLCRSLATRFATKLGQQPPQDNEAWLQEIVTTLSRAYGR